MIPNHLENISGENQHPKTYKPINIYGYILGKPPALQQWKVKASIGPFIKFKRLFKVYPLSQDVAVDLKIYKQSMFSCANMTIHLTIDEACWTRQCNSCGHSTRSLPKEMQTVPEFLQRRIRQMLFLSAQLKNIKDKMSIFRNFWHALTYTKGCLKPPNLESSFQDSKK